MRIVIPIVAVVLLGTVNVSISEASFVVYDGTPGIVAEDGPWLLDGSGHVWYNALEEWYRVEENDVPIPVGELRFWSAEFLVTKENELYRLGDATWLSLGFWPGAASVDEAKPAGTNRTRISPNPSTGSCEISFHLSSPGPFSAEIIDVSGRTVRHLFDGSHPAGSFSLIWDGKHDDGRDAAAGSYVTRVETTEGTSSGQIVLMR